MEGKHELTLEQPPSRFLSFFLATISLYLSTNAIVPFLLYGRELGPVEAESSAITLFRMILYPLAAVVIAANVHSIVDACRRVPFLSATLVLAPLSIMWSSAPELTLRSSVSLLASSVLGLCIASRFCDRDLMALFGSVFLLVIVTSVIFAAAIPEWGITEDPRGFAINGVFNTKGQMGRMMVLATLFFVVQTFANRRLRIFSLSLAAASGFLVLASQSQTSILVISLLIPTLLLLYLLQWHWLVSFWSITLFLIAVAVGIYNFQAIFAFVVEAMNRDVSLTGRTDLWSLVQEFIAERPLLGYGYDSFWRDGSGRADFIWFYMGEYLPHAHNGYLEVTLGLGLVGLTLVGLTLLIALIQALRKIRTGSGPFAYFGATVLLFTFVSNVAEVSILSRNSFYWIIVVICAARLARATEVLQPAAISPIFEGSQELSRIGHNVFPKNHVSVGENVVADNPRIHMPGALPPVGS